MYQVVEKSQLITGRTPKRRHEGVQRQKSRYLPGLSDSFLETFSRLRYLCIKRAIVGMIPLKALKGFRRRLRNHLPRLEKRRITICLS